jgi:hypothetical protein
MWLHKRFENALLLPNKWDWQSSLSAIKSCNDVIMQWMGTAYIRSEGVDKVQDVYLH